MDSTIPVHPAIHRAGAPFPPVMGQQPSYPQMMQQRMAFMPSPLMNPALASEKEN